jgi:protoheme ferro-lyase
MHIGVILTTYGEPRRNSFAEHWVYSYRILRRLTQRVANIPAPVLPIIATSRARGRTSLWRKQRFVSQLEPLHEQTVRRVGAALRERIPDLQISVIPAYEFRKPDLTDALRDLERRGCERAVIVPMYVDDGDFTHGMTRLALEDASRRVPGWDGSCLEFCGITDDGWGGRCAEALASFCLEKARERGIETPASDWAILLAAHGTVVSPLPGVDTGLDRFTSILNALKRSLRPHFGLVRIGWLNHTRGGTWTSPAVEDALALIQARGYRNLAYFPWGFTTDNAETALEGRMFIEETDPPFERVEHLPCINTDDRLIDLVADRVRSHLNGATSGSARPVELR